MTENKTFLQKYKRYVLPAAAILFLIFMLFGTPKGWNRAERLLEKYELIEVEKIRQLKDSIVQVIQIHKIYTDSIDKIETIIIPNFEKQFNQSEYEKSLLLQKLDSIMFAFYSKKRLDSFAENVKYK